MENKKIIVNPCICDTGRTNSSRAFCTISYKDGRLSIRGVIGPLSNGNCMGSCGQCFEEIGKGQVVDGWTQSMLDKFCDIWDKWHLNDMRPYCEHQKSLGWDKISQTKVPIYKYKLTSDALIKKIENPERYKSCLEKYSFLSYKKYEELDEKFKEFYKLFDTEYHLLGFLHPEEHPDGILTKECPVCGYKYGTSWKKEEVPEDVLEWLFNLPRTNTQPAWV